MGVKRVSGRGEMRAIQKWGLEWPIRIQNDVIRDVKYFSNVHKRSPCILGLCALNSQLRNQFYFFVNNKPVTVLFDIPHLLKNTRNALLTCSLEMLNVKFEYIKKAFELDKKKKFRLLDKLKPEYFKKGDRYYQMKVKVAAAQLSRSMAGSIEHFVASSQLPA